MKDKDIIIAHFSDRGQKMKGVFGLGHQAITKTHSQQYVIYYFILFIIILLFILLFYFILFIIIILT